MRTNPTNFKLNGKQKREYIDAIMRLLYESRTSFLHVTILNLFYFLWSTATWLICLFVCSLEELFCISKKEKKTFFLSFGISFDFMDFHEKRVLSVSHSFPWYRYCLPRQMLWIYQMQHSKRYTRSLNLRCVSAWI